MKKTVFYPFLISAFFTMISCSVEPELIVPSGKGKVEMTFHTYDGLSKTVIDQTGVVTWSEEDAICIFDGYYNNRFPITGGEGTASASFSGSAVPESEYAALYPYSSEAVYQEGVIRSVLSREQNIRADGSFDTMTNPSVALAQGLSLRFRNVAGLLMVKLVNQPQERQVKSITISSDKALAGEYTVSMNSGEDTYKAVAAGQSASSVTLVPLSTGISEYCAVIFPDLYTALNVQVNYADGTDTKAVFRNIDLQAGAGVRVMVDASVPEPVPDNSLYARYMAGEDVEVVPGMTINKADYGNAELIDADNPSIDNRNTKVYFVSPDVDATYDITTLVPVMFIVGDDPERRGTLRQNQPMKIGLKATDATGEEKFIMSNIEMTTVTAPQPDQSIFAIKKTNDCRIDYVHLHNCYIKFSGLNIFSSFNNDGRQVISINYTDNIFEFTPYEYQSVQKPVFISQLLADIAKLNPAELSELNFENNVFYNVSSDKILNSFKVVHSVIAGNEIDELNLVSNTFINVHSIPKGGFLDLANAGKLTIDKNLVWVNGTMTSNFNIAYVRSNQELTVGDNLLYKTDAVRTGAVVRYDDTTTSGHEFVVADTDPFSGVAFPDSFNAVSGYEGYGARF